MGALARTVGIEHFWTAGALCRHAAQAYGDRARQFSDAAALIKALPEAPRCAAALVKGSKFMHMPTVVAALQQQAATSPGASHAA